MFCAGVQVNKLVVLFTTLNPNYHGVTFSNDCKLLAARPIDEQMTPQSLLSTGISILDHSHNSTAQVKVVT